MRLALLLALLLLFVSACDSADPIEDIEDTWFAPSLEVDLSASTRTESGLYYRDLTEGDGPAVSAGDSVAVRYTGWFPNGARFDGNEQAAEPFRVRIGMPRPQVIQGWEEGLLGMEVGSVRQLIIPPHLGYGSEPIRHPITGQVLIPGNSILVFRVHLIDIL